MGEKKNSEVIYASEFWIAISNCLFNVIFSRFEKFPCPY
jgi:hypothetical protein